MVLAWAALLLTCMAALLPQAAYAQEDAALNGEDVVHIHLHDSDNVVHPSHIRLELYEVASGSWYEGELHLLSDFPESATHHNVDDVAAHSPETAADLEVWVKRDHPVEPLAVVESDANGDVVFDHLEDGVYLVCQQNKDGDSNGKHYDVEVMPFLIEEPMMNEEGELLFDYDCDPKIEVHVLGEDSMDVSVEKHWIDSNNQAGLRPNSIQVALLCNGEAYDMVTLDASMNWCYTWSGLASDQEWSVQEVNVPKGYTAKVTRENNTFILTNTVQPDEEQNPPDEGDGKPGKKGGNNTPSQKSGKGSSGWAGHLPQTGDGLELGMLVAAAGVSFCVLALATVARSKRRAKRSE